MMDGWWQKLVTELDAKKRQAHATFSVNAAAGLNNRNSNSHTGATFSNSSPTNTTSTKTSSSLVHRISEAIFTQLPATATTTSQQQTSSSTLANSVENTATTTNGTTTARRRDSFALRSSAALHSSAPQQQQQYPRVPAPPPTPPSATLGSTLFFPTAFLNAAAAAVTNNTFVNAVASPMINRRRQQQQQQQAAVAAAAAAVSGGGSQQQAQPSAHFSLIKRTNSDGNDRTTLNRLNCLQDELNQLDERIEYHIKIICLSRRPSYEADEQQRQQLQEKFGSNNNSKSKQPQNQQQHPHRQQQQPPPHSSLADERDQLFQLVARYAFELDQIARKHPYATPAVPSTLALCSSPSVENLSSSGKINFSNHNSAGATSTPATETTPSTPPLLPISIIKQQAAYKIGSVAAPSPVKREIVGMLDKLKARVNELNGKLNYAANALAAVMRKQQQQQQLTATESGSNKTTASSTTTTTTSAANNSNDISSVQKQCEQEQQIATPNATNNSNKRARLLLNNISSNNNIISNGSSSGSRMIHDRERQLTTRPSTSSPSSSSSTSTSSYSATSSPINDDALSPDDVTTSTAAKPTTLGEKVAGATRISPEQPSQPGTITNTFSQQQPASNATPFSAKSQIVDAVGRNNANRTLHSTISVVSNNENKNDADEVSSATAGLSLISGDNSGAATAAERLSRSTGALTINSLSTTSATYDSKFSDVDEAPAMTIRLDNDGGSNVISSDTNVCTTTNGATSNSVLLNYASISSGNNTPSVLASDIVTASSSSSGGIEQQHHQQSHSSSFSNVNIDTENINGKVNNSSSFEKNNNIDGNSTSQQNIKHSVTATAISQHENSTPIAAAATTNTSSNAHNRLTNNISTDNNSIQQRRTRQAAFSNTPTISIEFYDDFDYRQHHHHHHHSSAASPPPTFDIQDVGGSKYDEQQSQHHHHSGGSLSGSSSGMSLAPSSSRILLSPRKSISACSSRRSSITGLVGVRPNPFALSLEGLTLPIPTLAVRSTPESHGEVNDDNIMQQYLYQSQSLTPSPVGPGPGTMMGSALCPPSPGNYSMQRRRSSASNRSGGGGSSCSINLLPSADAHLPHVDHPPLLTSSEASQTTQDGPSVYVDGVHMLGTLIKQGVIVNADLIHVSLPTLGIRSSLNDALAFGIVNAESVIRFTEPNEVIVSPATTPSCNAATVAAAAAAAAAAAGGELSATNEIEPNNNNDNDDGIVNNVSGGGHQSSTSMELLDESSGAGGGGSGGSTRSTVISPQGSSIESLQQQQQRSPSRMPEHTGIASLDTAIDQSWYDPRKSAFFDPNTLEQITFVEAVNIGIVDSDAVLVRDPRNSNVLSVIEALERVLMDKNTGHMVDPLSGKRVPLIEAVRLRWIYEGVKPVTLVEALQQGWHDSETGNFRGKSGEPMTLHTAITSGLIDGERSLVVDPRSPSKLVSLQTAIKQAIVDPWTARVRNSIIGVDMSMLQAFEAGYLGSEDIPMSLYEVIDNGWYDPHSGRFLDPRMGDLIPLPLAIERGIIGQEAPCIIDSRVKDTISLRDALLRNVIDGSYAMYNIIISNSSHSSVDTDESNHNKENKEAERNNNNVNGTAFASRSITLIEAMDAGLLLPVRDASQQLGATSQTTATGTVAVTSSSALTEKRRRSHAAVADDGYPC